MIICNGRELNFEGTAVQLTSDFSMIVVGLIETLVNKSPIDTDDVITIMEKSFKLGVKAYFDFRAGEDNED